MEANEKWLTGRHYLAMDDYFDWKTRHPEDITQSPS
jgi:hypothetical protein